MDIDNLKDAATAYDKLQKLNQAAADSDQIASDEEGVMIIKDVETGLTIDVSGAISRKDFYTVIGLMIADIQAEIKCEVIKL